MMQLRFNPYWPMHLKTISGLFKPRMIVSKANQKMFPLQPFEHNPHHPLTNSGVLPSPECITVYSYNSQILTVFFCLSCLCTSICQYQLYRFMAEKTADISIMSFWKWVGIIQLELIKIPIVCESTVFFWTRTTDDDHSETSLTCFSSSTWNSNVVCYVALLRDNAKPVSMHWVTDPEQSGSRSGTIFGGSRISPISPLIDVCDVMTYTYVSWKIK